MAYTTLQIGVTGPKGRIGVGTEYHIDSKYNRSTSWEDIVKGFDAKANRYKQDGRNIVFSNQGVHGLVYNPDAPLADKISQLKKADAAHSHSVHKDFYSFDYYAPIGTDLWDKSAEGAPIYVAGIQGQKAEGHQGGGWGNSGLVIGKNGQVLMKSGHGDINQAVFKGGTFGAAPGSTTVTNTGVAATMDDPATAIQKELATRKKTAKEVVDGLGNNFGSMKSQRLGAALQGAQESIIQKRLDNGENFGTITEEITVPRSTNNNGGNKPGKVTPAGVEAPKPEAPKFNPATALYYGDSVSAGLGHRGAEGDENSASRVGRGASRVLSILQNRPENTFKDKDVVLSSGILNSQTDWENVNKQIELLQSKGANSIRLVGAPQYNKRFAGFNDRLKKISEQYGITFLGGYDARETDNLHPNYSTYPTYRK